MKWLSAFDAVPSGFFRPVERRVRPSDHVAHAVAFLEFGHSEAGRLFADLSEIGGFHGEPQRVGQPHGAFEIGLRTEDEELLASPASDDVGFSGISGKHVGDSLEHRVARLVSEPVVDRFEMVEIQHQDR